MHAKLKLIFTLLLLCNFVNAQDFPDHLTEEHQLIPGSNISMIPPASFENSAKFKGFQNPNDPSSFIMMVQIPGPYGEIQKGFNSKTLEPRGMILKSKTSVEISQFQGLLIELDQAANGLKFSKHILIYGSDSSTTFINGVFPEDSIVLGQSIKQSILSTYLNTDIEPDPREALDFTIQENEGKLKFIAVIGNGMLLNRDRNTPTKSEDSVGLVIDKSFENIEIKNKKQFCLSRLNQYPESYSVSEEKGINEIELDGLKGYELYAANNNEDKTEEIYQVILFTADNGYYIFVGTYSKDYTNALEDIKKVIATFKRK